MSTRVRVFVDYWNFQIHLNECEAESRGVEEYRFKIDWASLGRWMAEKACKVVGASSGDSSYDGMIVYTSYDPRTEGGRKFSGWATNWLGRQPGVMVNCLPRRPKSKQRCQSCHKPITVCPHCKADLMGTVEKGVDTFIATDLIRLAWEDAYEVAVLATLDGDLVPAVQFLNQRGRKVIQAGFPPKGAELGKACWGSFDVPKSRSEIQRPD